MKKIIALSLALLGALVLGGCGLSGGTSTKTPASVPVSVQETATTANSINIQNFAFNPGTLTVKKGAAVVWTNNDSAPHQIKSAIFNSDILSKGQSFSFAFSDAGTFDYSCAIHPSMTGKIIVE